MEGKKAEYAKNLKNKVAIRHKEMEEERATVEVSGEDWILESNEMVEKIGVIKSTLMINGIKQMLTIGCCLLDIPNLALNCCIMLNF